MTTTESTGVDQQWAHLHLDLRPSLFMTARPDTTETWLALVDLHACADRVGDLWLRADVSQATMAWVCLLRDHRPEGGSCVGCAGAPDRPVGWPCPIWRHLGEWLVVDDEPPPASLAGDGRNAAGTATGVSQV